MYAHNSSEYRREHEDKPSGWKSWFGFGDNKDREEDRDYKWSNTTTYRTNPTYPTYGPERTGFYGPRGGYGYTTTSDDYTPRPSWTTDRDYTTRPSYGTSGDREGYYKSETRTYGGDNNYTTPRRDVDRCDWKPTRPTGDYTPSWNTPSRPFGPSSDYTVSRPYNREYTSEYPTYRSTEYPTYRSTEYPTYRSTEYPTYRSTEYPTYRSTGEYNREYPTTSRYGFSGERTERYNPEVRAPERNYENTYSSRYNTNTEYPTRFPVTGDRDYPTTGRTDYFRSSRY